MEQETAVFKNKTLIFSETKEHAVQSELLLPDYYPEVEKVLHCSVQLSEESVSMQADKISVAGKASFTVLFSSAENRIYSFSGTEKYTKLISCVETQAGDVCIVRQTPAQVNVRATAPRRIELGAVAAVKAELWRFQETEVLTSAEAPRLETLVGDADYFCTHAFGDVTLETTQSVRLPAAREEITAVLHKSASFDCSQISAIGNKLLLRGTMQLNLSVITADGNVHAGLSFQIPVTETKDLFGAEENDVCFYCAGVSNVEVNLKAALGEKDAVEVSVFTRCTVLTGKPEKRAFLRDAYSLRSPAQSTAASVGIMNAVLPLEAPFAFSAQAECYDDAEKVCDAFISELRYSVSLQDDQLTVSGSAAVNALIKNRVGGYGFVSRTGAFSFDKQISPGSGVCCAVRVNNLSAAFGGNGLIQFNGDFCVQGFETQSGTETVLTSLELSETPARGAHEKIVVYYAAAGERVWDIAKENNSSVSLIGELNDLKADQLEQNTVLTFIAY